MKKIIKTLLVVMVVVLALTALTACDLSFFDKECQHSGGTATCTEKAVCEQCGESYGELLAHKEIKLPASASTCAKEGMTEGSYCKDCGTIIVAQTPVEKLDHVWVDNVDRDFTCTLDGYVGGKHCENCGIQDGTMEIIPAHHIWGETYVHTEPTCGKTGIKAHDCTVCGTKEKVEDIPATGNHNFTVEVEAKDPTCLPGYTAHLACEVCGQPNEDYTEIPGDAEEGHSFPEKDWFVYVEPTCTEAGVMAGYCEHCGKGFILFDIDPTHVDEDEDGVCDVCKENMPTEEPECEHVWGEGEVTTAPTCATAGVKTYTCSVCGETKTEDVAATGEHDYVEDVVDATCTAAGTRTYECSVCFHSYDEEIPAKDHVDENGDFLCDYGCKTVMAPEEGSTLTIAQALALAKLYVNENGGEYAGWYYVTGVIANDPGATYGGCIITDGTNSISVYGLKDSTGTNRYDAMANKPVKGDTVKLYGKVGAHYSTIQMHNSNVIELTAHGDSHNYVDGKCTKCFEDEPVAGTTTVTVKYTGTTTGNMADGNNASKVGLDASLFTVTSTKNDSQQHIGLNKNGYLAIYSVRASGKGNTLTISVEEGYTIVSVKVTFTTGEGYATFTVDGDVVTATNGVYMVNGASFAIQNTFHDPSASKNQQVQIASIEIVYQ